MAIDQSLLKILACPEDKGPLWFIESESVMYNPRTKRAFPVVDDIPVMLREESSIVSDEIHQRLQGLIDSLGIKPTFAA